MHPFTCAVVLFVTSSYWCTIASSRNSQDWSNFIKLMQILPARSLDVSRDLGHKSAYVDLNSETLGASDTGKFGGSIRNDGHDNAAIVDIGPSGFAARYSYAISHGRDDREETLRYVNQADAGVDGEGKNPPTYILGILKRYSSDMSGPEPKSNVIVKTVAMNGDAFKIRGPGLALNDRGFVEIKPFVNSPSVEPRFGDRYIDDLESAPKNDEILVERVVLDNGVFNLGDSKPVFEDNEHRSAIISPGGVETVEEYNKDADVAGPLDPGGRWEAAKEYDNGFRDVDHYSYILDRDNYGEPENHDSGVARHGQQSAFDEDSNEYKYGSDDAREEVEYDDGHAINYDHEDDDGHYFEDGGSEEEEFDEADSNGDYEESGKGRKEGHFGEKSGHKRGSKTTGYHNKLHKDEYTKDHKFYGHANNDGYFTKEQDYDGGHHTHSDGHKKGRSQDSGSAEDYFGKYDFDDVGYDIDDDVFDYRGADRSSFYDHHGDYKQGADSDYDSEYQEGSDYGTSDHDGYHETDS